MRLALGKLRNVDLPARARFLEAFGWLALAGMFFGAMIGYALGRSVVTVFVGALLGIAIIGGVGGAVLTLLVDRLGGTARVIYNPTGDAIPHHKDHSYAKSLAARGEYEKAIETYRASIEEDARDPGPYLAIARILRDELGRPREASEWFRRARSQAQLDAGTGIRVARELIELYRTKLGEPLRAAPELARLAETWPDTTEGRWAAAELAEIKREMAGGGEEEPLPPPSP